MNYRKRRIAWSVACGILCLLVIALWMRSYRWFDTCSIFFESSRDVISIQSNEVGILSLNWSTNGNPNAYKSGIFRSYFRETLRTHGGPSKANKFDILVAPYYWYFAMPCWFLVVTLGTLASIPWFRWQFSLRTLLVSMTVIAVGLGLAVYAVRH
jgi:hypothetical protein